MSKQSGRFFQIVLAFLEYFNFIWCGSKTFTVCYFSLFSWFVEGSLYFFLVQILGGNYNFWDILSWKTPQIKERSPLIPENSPVGPLNVSTTRSVEASSKKL